MKIIPELVRDSESFERYMKRTSRASKKHLLAEIDDEYVWDVYLTLLTTVAGTIGNFDEKQDNPNSYICKIAAALPKSPDMQEIFRRNLLLNEKILNDHVFTLNQHVLQNIFLFDALTMITLYAKDNLGAIEYVTNLSNLLDTGADGLRELNIIVKAVMNKKKTFTQKFEHLMLSSILQILRFHFRNINVETPDALIMEYARQTDVTKKFPVDIAGKNFVQLYNGYIHDQNKMFELTNCGKVFFINCRFENMEYRSEEIMFKFFLIPSVVFINCRFENIIGKREGDLFVKENIHPNVTMEGIIGYLYYSEIFLDKVSFKNCYYLDDCGKKLGRIGYNFMLMPALPGSLFSSYSLFNNSKEPTEAFNHKTNCMFDESAMIDGFSFFKAVFTWHKDKNSDNEVAGYFTYTYDEKGD